jgi:hypothetical protein
MPTTDGVNINVKQKLDRALAATSRPVPVRNSPRTGMNGSSNQKRWNPSASASTPLSGSTMALVSALSPRPSRAINWLPPTSCELLRVCRRSKRFFFLTRATSSKAMRSRCSNSCTSNISCTHRLRISAGLSPLDLLREVDRGRACVTPETAVHAGLKAMSACD